ncbi:hypothetical protein HpCHN43_02310 [Helicobacter pylori]|nr:hypothetical protein KVK06_01705 [Helicobacter pylori]
MPNTTAKKDYTQYSEKQLFNYQSEQKISQAFDDKNDCCLGHKIPNLKTQEAMREVGNKETDLIVEDFSTYSDGRKRALGVKT